MSLSEYFEQHEEQAQAVDAHEVLDLELGHPVEALDDGLGPPHGLRIIAFQRLPEGRLRRLACLK